MRFLPVLLTTSANDTEIKKGAENVLEKYFKQEEGVTYSITFKSRNNSQIGRNFIMDALTEIIKTFNSNNKVDLDKPEYAILVNIIKGVCLISVCQDFYNLKKYNLSEYFTLKTKND